MSIENVLSGESRHHVVLGDDEDVLPTIPSNSVDAVVTDPPCGINFMNVKFDSDRGGRDAWIAWMANIARECLRITKPGGHALVWGLPRTSHWTGTAWENAGWEVRDKVTHLNCLTPDTELLVNGEWVHHTNCVEGGLALCYDAEHDTFAWGPIQAVYEAHYSDSLYSLRGDRTDQLVTRGHRCPVERGGTTVLVRAEELAQEREARVPVLEDVQGLLNALPLPQQNSGRPQHGLPSLREGGAPGSTSANAETASDLRNVPRALHPEEQRQAGHGQALLSHMLRGTALDEDPRWTGTDGGCRSPGSGGVDGCLDGIVQGQDDRPEQPRVEGRGDGVQDPRELRRGAVRAVSTGVPAHGPEGRVRDGAPADRGAGAGTMPVTDGDGASRQSHPDGQPAGEPRPVQDQPGAQAVRASRFTTTDLVRIEPVPYDGIVWCVKVPTGAFVARRNGQVFVTGNSEGFPKSHSISKALAKLGHPPNVTSAYTHLGTGLKPASEDWWLLRKPCDQPTIAENVLIHGTGALDIDGTRVPTNPNDPILESKIAAGRGFGVNAKIYGKPGLLGAPAYDASKGRHMANLVVSHHQCVWYGLRHDLNEGLIRAVHAYYGIDQALLQGRLHGGHPRDAVADQSTEVLRPGVRWVVPENHSHGPLGHTGMPQPGMRQDFRGTTGSEGASEVLLSKMPERECPCPEPDGQSTLPGSPAEDVGVGQRETTPGEIIAVEGRTVSGLRGVRPCDDRDTAPGVSGHGPENDTHQVHHGASHRDGDEPGSSAGEDRTGSSPERNQRRQSTGEPHRRVAGGAQSETSGDRGGTASGSRGEPHLEVTLGSIPDGWHSYFVPVSYEGCNPVGTRTVPGVTRNRFTDGMKFFGEGAGHPYTSETGDPETLTTWECHPDCQAAALDRQSGYTASVSGGVAGWQDQYVGGELAHPVDRTGYDDAGGASRFFNTFRYVPEDNPAHESFIYTPKPSQSERHEGVGTGPTLRLRGDLTPEQKAYVMAELKKHGVEL